MKSENKKGYYNDKVMNKFSAALAENKRIVAGMIKNGEIVKVKFSSKNNKMGDVSSVSTLPFITCPIRCANTCGAVCYAAKLANLRPAVLNAYAWNTAVLMLAPDMYHAQIKEYCRGVRFFRYHVSGDITNKVYFENMVENARENKHCEILAFTKRFEVVNAWIQENGELPANLHIMFSGWNNMDPINPNKLPETTVYNDASEIRENWHICGGNCFTCAVSGCGCWHAKNGEMIAFKIH